MFLKLRDSVSKGDAAVIDEVERGEDFIKEKYEEALEDEELSRCTRRGRARVRLGEGRAR